MKTLLIALGMLGLLLIPAAADKPGLDARTEAALREALADERLAEATYAAVIDRHGYVRPFSNIVTAEQRHVQLLISLFDEYGLKVPEAEKYDIEAPDTVLQACRDGIVTEKRNIAMYDRFLEWVKKDDVRRTFIYLHDASRDNHLPAFRRCVDRRAR